MSEHRDSGFALLLVDIDRFEEINATYGHLFGDEVLQLLAHALRAGTREGDLRARVGGDEFLVFFEEVRSKAGLKQRCVDLLERLSATQTLCEHTVSVGVALAPDHGVSYDLLYQCAQQALRASQKERQSCCTIFGETQEKMLASSSPKSAGPVEDETKTKAIVPTPGPGVVGHYSGILRESEYMLLMNAVNVSVSKHLIDEHFTVVWANDRFYEMFGYTREEYQTLFQNQCDLFYRDNPQDWDELVHFISKEIERGASRYEYVCRIRHRDGRKLWIKMVGAKIEEFVEEKQLAYTVMMDITQQMQTQLEQTVTYNNFPGLISKFLVKEDGLYYINANRRYSEIFQKRERYLLEEMTPESGLYAIRQNYGAFRAGKFVSFALFQDDPNGQRVHMNVSAECVDWIDDNPVYLLLHTDVTQLIRQNEELERLAFTDLVTEGMNRARFNMVAEATLRAAPAHSYSLVCLNIQKFKLINDTAGKETGNRTLRYVHNVIKARLRPGELVARIFADNFDILMEADDNETLLARLDNMVNDINAFNRRREIPYYLAFTAGICQVDEPGMEITKLQARAQIARQESNIVEGFLSHKFYSDNERARLIEEKDVENKMRPALQNHEFVIYLQPKLSLATHKVGGAEALVRWLDSQNGLVMPDSFIPIFEKNGFILQLDSYVLEEACRLLRKWMDCGLAVQPISVNLSRVHFIEPDFVRQYAAICNKYDVSTGLIELEVTETAAFKDPALFSALVKEMHRHGFLCSMDDFGSGYSSLNQLKDLRVDTLKLDRAFFSTPEMDNERERDVVTSVVEMAKKLRMNTVAEGVETKEQQAFFEKTCCDLLQGYVFSRPLPVEEYEKFVFGFAVDALSPEKKAEG